MTTKNKSRKIKNTRSEKNATANEAENRSALIAFDPNALSLGALIHVTKAIVVESLYAAQLASEAKTSDGLKALETHTENMRAMGANLVECLRSQDQSTAERIVRNAASAERALMSGTPLPQPNRIIHADSMADALKQLGNLLAAHGNN